MLHFQRTDLWLKGRTRTATLTLKSTIFASNIQIEHNENSIHNNEIIVTVLPKLYIDVWTEAIESVEALTSGNFNFVFVHRNK